jgi:hypothetical protein
MPTDVCRSTLKIEVSYPWTKSGTVELSPTRENASSVEEETASGQIEEKREMLFFS